MTKPMAPMASRTRHQLSRGNHAYDRIRQAIVDSDLHPGQLLQEANLATWLGMSRTPIREALNRLASEGLVQVGEPRRLYVAELSLKTVEDVYHLIEVVEGLACRLAAEKGSSEDLESIARALKSLEEATDRCDLESWIARDKGIHDAVAQASGSDRLRGILGSLYASVERVRHLHMKADPSAERLAEGTRSHRQLVEPILERDPIRAEMAGRELAALAREEAIDVLTTWMSPLRRAF